MKTFKQLLNEAGKKQLLKLLAARGTTTSRQWIERWQRQQNGAREAKGGWESPIRYHIGKIRQQLMYDRSRPYTGEPKKDYEQDIKLVRLQSELDRLIPISDAQEKTAQDTVRELALRYRAKKPFVRSTQQTHSDIDQLRSVHDSHQTIASEIMSEIPRDTNRNSPTYSQPIMQWHPTAQNIYSRVRHLARDGTIESNNPHETALHYASMINSDGSLDPSPHTSTKLLRIAATGDEKLKSIISDHLRQNKNKEI